MHRLLWVLLLSTSFCCIPAIVMGEESAEYAAEAAEATTEEAAAEDYGYDSAGPADGDDDAMGMYIEAVMYQMLGGLFLMGIWVIAALFGLYLCARKRIAAGGCLTFGAVLHLIFFPLQVMGECYIFYFDEGDFNPEMIAGLFNLAMSLFFVTGWVLVICSVALMGKAVSTGGQAAVKT